MRRILPLLGALLGAICLVLFFKAISSQWAAFNSLSINTPVLIGLGLAIASYLSTYLLSSRSWQLMLLLTGVTISYGKALRVVATSQLGKYLPGNVGQHLGRVVLARKMGINAGQTITSMILETITLVLSACLCSLAAFELLPEVSLAYGTSVGKSLVVLSAVLVITIASAMALPWSRRQIRILGEKLSFLFSDRRFAGLSSRAVAIHTASFGLGAASLWLTLGAMLPDVHPPTLSLVGVYAVAWLVGFVVPGAPAGLGIREALLVFGLSPMYGADVATTSTAAFRLVTVIGDGVAFGLGIALSSLDETT